MHPLIVSGSIAYDRIMEFGGRFSEHLLPDQLDHLSVSFTVTTFAEGFGGTAGNIAYNLSLLGLAPTILATAGNDFEKYAAWLRSKQIDPASIAIALDVPTASAYMTTDTADNQIASFYLGAMVRPYDRQIDIPKDALAIIAPGNNEDMASFAKSYRDIGVRYLFDPGQQAIMLSKEDLRAGISGAAALFANEYEIGIISERTGWSTEEIASHVPAVIVTLAQMGTRIIEGASETTVAAVPVEHAADPTGAGDAYRAGFMYGLVRDMPLKRCVEIASAVAAYAVEKKGTQNHMFSMPELDMRFTAAYRHTVND